MVRHSNKVNQFLLVGSGDLAVALLKDLSRSVQWRVVGLLDNDKHMLGRLLLGVRVIGTVDQLPEVAKSMGLLILYWLCHHRRIACAVRRFQ